MSKAELKGQVLKSQIDDWKKQHGVVKAIIVNNTHICYVKEPSRTEVEYASTIAGTNPLQSNAILLDSVWLGGSEEIRTDNKLFYGASKRLTELIGAKEAILVDL
jgi:hypothetical protein